jgi:hypothetical protein
MIPGAGACDVKQVPLSVVDLLQVGVDRIVVDGPLAHSGRRPESEIRSTRGLVSVRFPYIFQSPAPTKPSSDYRAPFRGQALGRRPRHLARYRKLCSRFADPPRDDLVIRTGCGLVIRIG